MSAAMRTGAEATGAAMGTAMGEMTGTATGAATSTATGEASGIAAAADRVAAAGGRASGSPDRASGATVLRLGTRRSRLATTQSGWVADLLRGLGHRVEFVEIATEGDVNSAPLTQIGGTGVFASALRAALRDGRVDLAVHSLKDLPVAPEPGLVIAAVPRREDPRDALCAREGLTLAELPAGARVGTGSPRRAAQLAARRPDLEIVEIRGNVETRLGRVGADLDAVVLAYAGLRRLGLQDRVSEVLDTARMLPAAGQGALAVECRADRADLVATLARLDDPPTRLAVEAERALLARLEAGCTAPIGALAQSRDEAGLRLEAFVGGDAGSFVRAELSLDDIAADGDCAGDGSAVTGSGARALGVELAQRLLEQGAGAPLPTNRATDTTPPAPAVGDPGAAATSDPTEHHTLAPSQTGHHAPPSGRATSADGTDTQEFQT